MFGPMTDPDGNVVPDATGGYIDPGIKPTQELYDMLQQAYEHFNFALFDHRLPNCLITLQRKGRCYGYFAADRMARRDGTSCDEIALNPVHFRAQGDLRTLSILVHEMVHLWQRHFASPGRGRYHNRQWAAEMKRLGLHPSDTGAPDGRETGDRMSHYVIPGGLFERAAKELIAGGFVIAWTEAQPRPRARHKPNPSGPSRNRTALEDESLLVDGILHPSDTPEQCEDHARQRPETPDADTSRSGVRRKFRCPVCGRSVWHSGPAFTKCIEHDVPLEPVD